MSGLGLASNETRSLSRAALLALREVPGLAVGPLSPLTRIGPGQAAPDTDGLIQSLQEMAGSWSACPAALLDPGLSLAVIVADRRTQASGQYVWADPHGLGAGFRVEVHPESVELTGPIHLEALETLLVEQLAPQGVATPEPLRLSLDAVGVWTLLALVDAHGTSALIREAARGDGPLPALKAADLAESWQLGRTRPNPGWAVSMAALLAPDLMPGSADAALAGLPALEAAGLVTRLPGGPGDALGELLLPGAALAALADGLGRQSIRLGLVKSLRTGPGRVEIVRLMVWRLAVGYVLLDLSAMAEGRAELLWLGPAQMLELLGVLLGLADPPGVMPTPSSPSPEALIEALQVAVKAAPPPMPAAPSPPPLPRPASAPSTRHCAQCGAAVSATARFCSNCGAKL
jgi:hypothetical protein